MNGWRFVRILLAPGWITALGTGLFIAANGLGLLFGNAALPLHLLVVIYAFVGMGIYGWSRCEACYPGANAAYATWLSQTPWKPGCSLPLGPSHVWWQDVVVFFIFGAILTVDGWILRSRTYSILLIDPLEYLSLGLVYLVVAFTLGFGGRAVKSWHFLKLGVEPLLLAIVGPMALFVPQQPLALLAVTLLVLAIVNVGMLRSMSRFPWSEPRPMLPDNGWLGWPMASIGPAPMEELPRGSGVAIGALIAWWIYSIAEFMDRIPGRSDGLEYFHVMALASLAGVVFGGIRLLLYSHCHRWPIGPLARLLTGRLIIPRYDFMLLAPMFTAMTGWIVSTICISAGFPATAGLALSLGSVVAVGIELGPSLRSWSLTGDHRIVPGNITSNPTGVTRKLSSDMKQGVAVRR